MAPSDATVLRKLHLALDAAVVLCAMWAAAAVQPQARALIPDMQALVSFHEYALLSYLALPLWLLLVVGLGLHHSFEEPLGPAELFVRLLKLHLGGLLGLALIHLLTRSVVNRSLIAIFLCCAFCLMYAERLLLGFWVRLQHARGQTRTRILLVGQPSKRMADFLDDARAQALPPTILGYLEAPEDGAGKPASPSRQAPATEQPPRLGSLGQLGELLQREAVDHVMFFPPAHRPQELSEALQSCEELGVAASFAVEIRQIARATPRIVSIYDHPFVSFERSAHGPQALALKHGLDPLLAAVLLLLLSPLMLVIALAIVVTMGRPVLYAQQRAGLYGRPFRMFKFRSMVRGAEGQRDELLDDNEMDGPVFKMRSDPRVTPLGRQLRRHSLDELPQLFNVLLGSMSLVGPRPLPLTEQNRIRGWQRRRLSMKPGVTGLWQVSGRHDLDFEEWMLLDLKYIDDWSPWLDLTILLRTLPTVVLGRGA
ncbi:MAG: exopolysaccharide biosynthesis polyprenyl glycosylphosphotransferase [Myxococcales bacterium]|nr:exopolysaccharide biosynthesis polyprenyl glycosylphosphotransferase [Myxococcales bacterium]